MTSSNCTPVLHGLAGTGLNAFPCVFNISCCVQLLPHSSVRILFTASGDSSRVHV